MPTVSAALQIALQHHQAGRLDLAGEIYRRILEAEPDHVEALHLLGVICHQQGRHEAAIEHLRRAIERDRTQAPFHNNLAEVYRALGQVPEAVACYQRALELDPNSVEILNNLGIALKTQGQLERADECFRQALARKPDCVDTNNNLGNLRQLEGRIDEAMACYRRALELNPHDAKTYVNLGTAYNSRGDLDEAIACCRRALELEPERFEALRNLGSVLRRQGRLDEAIACHERALELGPRSASAHSVVLGMLHYRPGVGLQSLAHAHAQYERRHAAPLRTAWKDHDNRRDPGRPLRLGFVSADLVRHPVGYFLIPVVESLDRRACEVVCYAEHASPDDITARFRKAADAWHEVRGSTDDQLAARVRADRIDILFDLAGHTTHNRLLVFARKPAPIQITWLGYVGTTGLAAMDYLLADRHEVPPEAEPYYCEKVLRMPDSYVCFDPPADAPPVGRLPALESGQVTFASFSNPAKISPQAVAAWARILRQVPRSRLVLKYWGLHTAGAQSWFRRLFAEQGVDAERVKFDGWSARGELLGCYNQVDLALDTFPYSGGLTTCEALWMGVPVITCPGETFASRHSLSHLSTVGLTETIAHDWEEYVRRAVELAHDLPRLAALRARLRPQVAASPLCDGPRFAADFLNLLRAVWQNWCSP